MIYFLRSGSRTFRIWASSTSRALDLARNLYPMGNRLPVSVYEQGGRHLGTV